MKITLIILLIILLPILFIWYKAKGKCNVCEKVFPLRTMGILEASEISSMCDKYICKDCSFITCYLCEEPCANICPYCENTFCDLCFAEHECPEWEPDWDLMRDGK